MMLEINNLAAQSRSGLVFEINFCDNFQVISVEYMAFFVVGGGFFSAG